MPWEKMVESGVSVSLEWNARYGREGRRSSRELAAESSTKDAKEVEFRSGLGVAGGVTLREELIAPLECQV